MPQIKYQVVQKPLEQRIIDAATIYWDVERSYFIKDTNKDESIVCYRRSIIYYLIKHNTSFTFGDIAKLFGFKSHSAVLKAVNEIECTKQKLRHINTDLNAVLQLADKINADFVTTDTKLITTSAINE